MAKKKEPGSWLAELRGMVEGMDEDHEKFYTGGNRSAGRRLRKTLQEIKREIKPWRDEIQEHVQSIG